MPARVTEGLWVFAPAHSSCAQRLQLQVHICCAASRTQRARHPSLPRASTGAPTRPPPPLWAASCTATSWRASTGCCKRTARASTSSWQTRWAWARPSRPWPTLPPSCAPSLVPCTCQTMPCWAHLESGAARGRLLPAVSERIAVCSGLGPCSGARACSGPPRPSPVACWSRAAGLVPQGMRLLRRVGSASGEHGCASLPPGRPSASAAALTGARAVQAARGGQALRGVCAPEHAAQLGARVCGLGAPPERGHPDRQPGSARQRGPVGAVHACWWPACRQSTRVWQQASPAGKPPARAPLEGKLPMRWALLEARGRPDAPCSRPAMQP